MGSTVTEHTRASRRQKPRRRVSITGVFGEILLTLGVIALLFVAWQMWFSGVVGQAQNGAEARELSERWDASTPAPPESPDEIPVRAEAANGERFGVMYVPRFGDDYMVPIGGGVDRIPTLDEIGIGHYPGTAMPGGEGNASFAAHRTGFGGWPFYRIAELQPGDAIVVETEDGWYTYRFRNYEYVLASGIEVVNPVPGTDEPTDGQRYLTLTSCSPVHTTQERIIAYSLFDSFTPRGETPPDEVVLAQAGA